MSSKAPQKTPAQPDDPWRSGRARFNILRLRRGRDKKWHFVGQQEGEVVRLVVREHKAFLILPALPFIGSIVLLFITLGATTMLQSWAQSWLLVNIAEVILVIGTGIWFLYRDFIAWWYKSYIITNKRIISSRGLLEPTRQQTSMEKVTQVGIDMATPLNFLLSYGTIHVYYAGGELIMKRMPDPKRVKEAIQGVTEEIKSKKKEEKLTPVQDPEMAALLKKLGEGKEVPKLHDADEHYPPLGNPDRYRGPRRTFGGPLRVACGVHYTSGETTVEYIQRSRYVLYRNLLIPILLLLLVLSTAIYGPASGFISSAAMLPWDSIMALVVIGLLVFAGLIITNYVDDVYILTSKRIIEIERRLVFLYEARIDIEYKQIRDVKVKVPHVLQRLLDIGNVSVETPGSSPDIILKNVDHPFIIQDKIYDIKGHSEKAEKIKKENESKQELTTWFTNVVSKLEQTTEIRMQKKGVPDLQKMYLFDAIEQAQAYGLELEVKREEVSPSPPGQIIDQNPVPGTMIIQGGKVQVVLSKRR